MAQAISNPSTSDVLDWTSITRRNNLTIVRDSTNAADAIPLMHHFLRALTISKRISRKEILFVSTQTRSVISPKSNTYIHSPITRAVESSFTCSTACDPFALFASVLEKEEESHITRKFLEFVSAAIKRTCAKLVVIECLYSLRFSFGVNVSAFLRSLSFLNEGIPVMLSAPIEREMDAELSVLADQADNVIDLFHLHTGYASDVDGTLAVSKQEGRWLVTRRNRRYKITDSSFKIYS